LRKSTRARAEVVPLHRKAKPKSAGKSTHKT
jgi:hypothetical protein